MQSLNEPRLSLKQVAKLLDKNISTIHRWRLRGARGRKLPTFLIGGRRYVLREELEAFIAEDDSASSNDASESPKPQDDVEAELDRQGI